jgi:hypothetical protein
MQILRAHEFEVMKVPMQFTRFRYMTKIGMRCAVSVGRIFSPVFYHETVNLDLYIKNILESFFE